ncbi:hypothetical protein ACLKA6_013884 [Drosophila palustris]
MACDEQNTHSRQPEKRRESVKISVMDRMLKLSDVEVHSCASKSRRASHNVRRLANRPTIRLTPSTECCGQKEYNN